MILVKGPVLLTLALVLASLAAAFGARPEGAGRLIVHEWGTFTSVTGEDGMPVEWRPLSDPGDLPRFVHGIGDASADRCPVPGPPPRSAKGSLSAIVRMETPVIYFYADHERTVSVDVAFPDGRITEWYPRALSVGPGIAWGPVDVLPGRAVDPPVENEASHYYVARRTDSAPVRVGGRERGEAEKFLFYRGVGRLTPPLSLLLRDRDVVVQSLYGSIPRIVLFEKRGGRVGWGVHPLGNGQTILARPRLDGDVDSLCRGLEAILVSHGLYAREARAMVDTWRGSWFEEGLRAFYVLPQTLTDAVLPLALDPKPDELVRVLVARTEVITPEMVEVFAAEVGKLGAAPDARRAALDFVRSRGRFAEPILKRLQARTRDAETRARIEELIRAAP